MTLSNVSERRSRRRSRVLQSGSIVFHNLRSTIDCRLLDMSDAGACLSVASPLGIPDEFELAFSQTRERRPCRAAWRAANRLGICFA